MKQSLYYKDLYSAQNDFIRITDKSLKEELKETFKEFCEARKNGNSSALTLNPYFNTVVENEVSDQRFAPSTREMVRDHRIAAAEPSRVEERGGLLRQFEEN